MSDPTPDLVPTSVATWGTPKRVEEGFVQELPSGNVARIKRTLDMMTLLQTGQLPNPMRSIVLNMINTQSTEFPVEQATPEVLVQFADLLNDIAVRSFIEPPLQQPAPQGKHKENGVLSNPDETREEYEARIDAWVPDEGYLSVWDVDMEDKLFVFAVAQGGAADAKQFREQQASNVAPVEPVKKSPKPTKRTGGTGKRAKKS